MNGLAYAAALVLAAVFAWAAVAKLIRPALVARSFADLGLPAPSLLARVVPAAELVVAIALVASPWVGAALALGLLVFFTTLLLARLLQGFDAPCACFGSAASDPLSSIDIARNALMAVGAALALAASKPEAPGAGAAAVVIAATAAGGAMLAVARRRRRVRPNGLGSQA